MPEQHVEHDIKYDRKSSYQVDQILFAMFEEFLKNVPIEDLELNQKIMTCFFD